jgi:hypothetical protein
MTIYGPVDNAAHSVPTVGGALFPIAIGLSVLTYGWVHFFRNQDERQKPPLRKVIELSLICCTIIAIGVWEWIRASRT